jgi:hypothetical protein
VGTAHHLAGVGKMIDIPPMKEALLMSGEKDSITALKARLLAALDEDYRKVRDALDIDHFLNQREHQTHARHFWDGLQASFERLDSFNGLIRTEMRALHSEATSPPSTILPTPAK